MEIQINKMYPLFYINQKALNFLSPELEVTWLSCQHNSSSLLSPYLWIRGVSYSIHYNQSRRIYINQRHQSIRLIWS